MAVYVCVSTYICMFVCMYMYAKETYIRVRKHWQNLGNALYIQKYVYILWMYVGIQVLMYVYMCVYIYLCMCIYAYMYECNVYDNCVHMWEYGECTQTGPF